MKKALKKIIHPFYKRYHFWSHKKTVKYRYKNVYTLVPPGVFSPKNTLSTKVFLDYISRLNLDGQKVLELGCGSGIMAIYCASQRAEVTATDINKIALESLKKVSKKQGLNIETRYSDLFGNISEKDFNFIFINPPYFPKQPANVEESAWFCGENFEYFQKLFPQLLKIMAENTKVLMILSDECDLKTIQNISENNNLIIEEVHHKKLFFETNYIYQIKNIGR